MKWQYRGKKNFFRSLNDGLGFIVDVITTMLCNAYHIYLIFRVVKVARSAKIAFLKIRKFSVVYVSTYCCMVHCTSTRNKANKMLEALEPATKWKKQLRIQNIAVAARCFPIHTHLHRKIRSNNKNLFLMFWLHARCILYVFITWL